MWYHRYDETDNAITTPVSSGKIHAIYLQVIRLANRSAHTEQPMAALTLKAGAVVKKATNGSKYGRHAEWRAIRGKSEADTIIVARHNGRMSRPCLDCQEVLRDFGIQKMIYANRYSVLVYERLI